MKSLSEYINEAQWKSCNGEYDGEHAEALSKSWGITLKQAYKALDHFDDEIHGGPITWSKKKKFVVSNPDEERSWQYNLDDEEWTEIKYEKLTKI